MGISTAAQKGRSSVRSSAFLAGGLAVWLCGVFAVALAAAMTAVLTREAWREFAGSEYLVRSAMTSFGWSGVLAALALPAAVIALDERAAAFTRARPFAAAAIALVALNLPIMTFRFRAVIRSVPQAWRIAAAAAGATPVAAFVRICVPRASREAMAVTLRSLGQMLGETAAVVIVLNAAGGSTATPLPVDVWQRLTQVRSSMEARPAALETLLLVVAVVALRLASRQEFDRPAAEARFAELLGQTASAGPSGA